MHHEFALRAMFGILGILLLVGFVTVLSAEGTPTAQVVADPCDCAPGEAVCAALGETLVDYASSCEAECSGARVVFAGKCAQI